MKWLLILSLASLGAGAAAWAFACGAATAAAPPATPAGTSADSDKVLAKSRRSIFDFFSFFGFFMSVFWFLGNLVGAKFRRKEAHSGDKKIGMGFCVCNLDCV